AALKGEVASRRVYDLVEHEPHSLREIVRGFRRRLGFSPARFEPDLPRWVGAAVALAADIAGALGWRSPLRSTALKVLSENVVGDGAPWTKATGMTFKSLEETLSEIPSTAQERVFARFEIVRPVLIVVLALYWIASGVVGFLALDQASAHLLGVVERPIAAALVGAASAIDIVIGAGLLVRATAQSFALISIAVAAFYLAAGTLIAPELWLDPLGVLVKVVPVIALAAAVALMTTER
ncbi:MAG: DoxX-like family protein, partial [Parvularculaceae bacterium]